MEKYRNRIIALVVMFVLLGFAIYFRQSGQYAKSYVDLTGFNLVAVSQDAAGMNLDSPIKITSKEPVTIKNIQNLVEIKPQVPYEIEKKGNREFLVKFSEPLEPGSLYRVNLKGSEGKSLSWAFQTKKDFKIVRTLPRHHSVYVPIDSGIEIQFNQQGVNPIDDFFEITPKVEGRFEYYKNTAIFVHKGLQKDTPYTVKIKKGLGIKGSDQVLEDDFVFKFKTEGVWEDKTYLNFTDELYTLTPKSLHMLEMQTSRQLGNTQFKVEIYRYIDDEDFIKNMMKIDENRFPWENISSCNIDIDSKMEKISEFETEFKTGDPDIWHKGFLVLPEKLDMGDYLINVYFEDEILQTHVQVKDLAVYAMVGTKEDLLWINDVNSSRPVEGAKVTDLITSKSMASDSQGIALLKQEKKIDGEFEKAYFKIEKAGKLPFLVRVKPQYEGYDYYTYGYGGWDNTDYWSYIYTDRDMYLPNDTVNIWGMVNKREGKMSSKLSLHLNKYDSENGFIEVDKKEISLSDFNTFQDSFKIKNLLPESYAIYLKSGYDIIARKHFYVREYTKPAYKIDAKLDKDAIFSWDMAKLTINASFYEGTPISDLKLRYSYYEDTKHQEGKLVCDENGYTKLNYRPRINKDGWYPENVYINIHNAEAEDEEIYTLKNIMVFPKDVMINVETKASQDKTQGYVTINTNKIDIDKGKKYTDYGFIMEKFKGSPIDMNLDIKIFEVHYDPEEIGQYYDFIAKKVVKKYRYYQRRELLDTVNGKTSKGELKFDFPINPKKSYEIEVRGKDTRGNNILTKEWFAMYDYYEMYYPKRYELATEENEKGKYRVGETANIKLTYNGEEVPQKKQGKMLYLVLQNGLKDYKITDKFQEKFIFNKDFVPNTFVGGVYFDGEGIYRAGTRNLRYDYDEQNLDIKVEPDKKEYRPGDTVNLDILVTKPDGTPVNSEVNLSVVDESFFALMEQDVDILRDLYDYCFTTGILMDYVSYKKIDLQDMGLAEGGGEGGDESLRWDFKDTSLFQSVNTDRQGKGSISFKLPDNLTSWRVTYQAVNSELYAGSGKININAKLPFFLNLIMSDKYLVKDTPSISLRGFGTKVQGRDVIDYKLQLEASSGKTKEFQKTNTAGKYTNIDLGKLDEGDYTLTVEARCGKYTDAVRREFSVVDSTLEVLKTKTMPLSPDIKIPKSKGFTVLNFYNKEASLYYNTLDSLRYSWGERIDQVLSQVLSNNMLKEHFDEKGLHTEPKLGHYQREDGGIALLPYSESEPIISAKVASLGMNLFDENALRGYFYGILTDRESTKEDMLFSYWGLAALDEPVLIDIVRLLEEEKFDIREQLILANALADLKDEARALDIYHQIIKKHGKTSGNTLYIDAEERNDILEFTSLTSVLATKLKAPERYELSSYVAQNRGDKILTNLEQLICISKDIPDIPKEASFTYTFQGESKKVEFAGNQSFALLLKPEDVDKLSFKAIDGDIMVSASYSTKIKDIGKTDDNIGLERNYITGNSKSDTFEQSDIVKVVLTPKFTESSPEGYYEITDIIPAGLRYVKYAGDFDLKTSYPMEVSGQKVIFGYYYDKKEYSKKKYPKDIVYYIRAAVPGTYTRDHSVIKHTKSNTIYITDKKAVEIK